MAAMSEEAKNAYIVHEWNPVMDVTNEDLDAPTYRAVVMKS